MEGPITQLPVYYDSYDYTKADGKSTNMTVPFFEIPAGTLLFRGVQLPNPKKDEDPRLFVRDWLGYPKGDRFCMTPTHNTFFYTSPYVPFGAHTVGEWFNAIMVYQTIRNLRLVCMINPSKMTRGGKEIKALDGGAPIQRCDKFDYSCFESKTSLEARKEKELKSFDNCLHPDFVAQKQVSGWMAIADYDSLDNFKEGLKGKDTTMGKYIIDLNKRLPGKGIELLTSTYTDGTNHRGFPEIVLFPWSPHPGKENQYTEARTEEDAADAIAEMSDRFNYLPLACITERGILEAFTGDFKAGDLPRYATSAMPGALTRKTIDRYQAEYLEKLTSTGISIEGLWSAKAMFDSRTGFYVMDSFTKAYQNFRDFSLRPYTDFLLEYETREEREKVLEYKVKYRTFFSEAFGQEDTLIDGTVVKRQFVFERPPELYEQFKELGLRFPAKLIPYIWEATERFMLNSAERKGKTADPRGAEEARRKANEAKEKIKESLAIIAKKKEELDKKKGKKPEAKQEPKTPPLPLEPKTPEMPPQKVITYKYLNGVQSTIPVVRTMEEAIDIGMDALQQPNLLDFSEYKNDGLYANIMRGPWDINKESLQRTLSYIFEGIHANCYLLCVRDTQPYLFKLEARGLTDSVRKVLEEDIEQKNLTDINLDNTRVMQCIIKPYAEESTVATEWLTFLQNPLNRKYLLPNGIFILNLSDSVLLRMDRNEPFEVILANPVPLKAKYKGNFLPIFSYSGKRGYHDLPIPTFDDIEVVTKGEVLEEGLIRQMYQKDIDKAVFRGSTTGCGINALNNQRLKLTSPEFLNSLKNKDMLDVGITKVTKQYKYDPDFGLGKVDPSTPVVAPLTYAEQSHYKYIIHVDGNVFAYRLLKTMLLGSCILRVFSEYSSWLDVNTEYGIHGYDIDTFGVNTESVNADPYQCHFIFIKPDLSNLDDVLDFCNEHQDIVNIIADNAKRFAERVLNMKYIFASFVNLLAASVDISSVQEGGSKKKQKGTRKTKEKKQKTRKQKKKEQKLELAVYRGGGIEDDMREYIQGTMHKMWKNYIKSLR